MLSLLLLLNAYILCSLAYNTTNGVGIYHGTVTPWADNPFMASIRRDVEGSEHCCAATIISLDPGVIVTAAHCVYSEEILGRNCGSTVMIGCDHADCTNNGVAEYQIDPTKIVIHPNFEHELIYNEPAKFDIAIVGLNKVIDEPSNALNISFEAGDPCCEDQHPLTVLGYGRTRISLLYGSLRNGTEEYLRNAECNEISGTDQYTDQSLICFLDEWDDPDETVGVCGGDNGGPVISQRSPVVVGVISWEATAFGIECNVSAPQAAANVGYVLPWIQATMANM